MSTDVVQAQPRKLPTREQWRTVESALSRPYGNAVLLIDGYTVTFQVVPLKPLHYTICTYVQGKFLGKWLMEDCEERRRFFRVRERKMLSSKVRAEFVKEYGKRALKNSTLNQTFKSHAVDWPAFRPLKRHLLANNQDIEVISHGHGL